MLSKAPEKERKGGLTVSLLRRVSVLGRVFFVMAFCLGEFQL